MCHKTTPKGWGPPSTKQNDRITSQLCSLCEFFFLMNLKEYYGINSHLSTHRTTGKRPGCRKTKDHRSEVITPLYNTLKFFGKSCVHPTTTTTGFAPFHCIALHKNTIGPQYDSYVTQRNASMQSPPQRARGSRSLGMVVGLGNNVPFGMTVVGVHLPIKCPFYSSF